MGWHKVVMAIGAQEAESRLVPVAAPTYPNYRLLAIPALAVEALHPDSAESEIAAFGPVEKLR